MFDACDSIGVRQHGLFERDVKGLIVSCQYWNFLEGTISGWDDGFVAKNPCGDCSVANNGPCIRCLFLSLEVALNRVDVNSKVDAGLVVSIDIHRGNRHIFLSEDGKHYPKVSVVGLVAGAQTKLIAMWYGGNGSNCTVGRATHFFL